MFYKAIIHVTLKTDSFPEQKANKVPNSLLPKTKNDLVYATHFHFQKAESHVRNEIISHINENRKIQLKIVLFCERRHSTVYESS